MNQEKLDVPVLVKVSRSERAEIERQAKAELRTMSNWVRSVVLEQLQMRRDASAA
jgi:hypothetical protein